MRVIYFFLFFFFAGPCLFAQSSNAVSDGLVTNGDIKAMIRDGNTLYLGGSFQYVGPTVDFGAALDGTTGVVDPSYLRPNGAVFVTIPDGSGGWYIGGDFTSVGGQSRNRLARINSDGTLHAWNPSANNTVRTLVLSGSTIYIGGHFTSLSPNGGTSVSRSRLAAVDASTGAVVSAWNPSSNDIVMTLAVSGSVVYAGGYFSSLSPNGGTSVTRSRLAALDASTGEVISGWDPSPNDFVKTIAVSGGTVYVGGNFSSLSPNGGAAVTRNYLAAVDAGTGAVTAWDPNAKSSVNTLAVSGGTVYVGGFFNGTNAINGNTTRNRLAAVDASTGAVTAWDPNANNVIYTIIVSGGTVYLGGAFNGTNAMNGTTTRNHLAAVDATTGAVTAWNPNSSNQVWSLSMQSGTVYAGGDFVSIGGDVRNRLAAVDLNTGQLTAWDPNADGTVWSLALSGSTLYAGGDFSNVGGQSRSRMAALSTTDATATSWNPNVTGGSVRAIAVGGSSVFIGGNFSSAGGQTRNRIAALDATINTNNAISTWNPGTSSLVRALAVSGSTLYVGGDFSVRDGGVDEYGDILYPTYSTIGGQTRNYLAALNASTGTVTSWNPDPNDIVFSLAVNGSTVYAGGNFNQFDPAGSGITRNRIAALNATTGIPTSWNPNVNSTVYSIVVSGSAIYAGGSFTSVGGQSRNRAAVININTGLPAAWNPNSNGTINSIEVGSTGVYAGGGFSTMGGVSRRNIAAFPITSVDWGGSSGGSWNQVSNWAPGIVPNSSLDVSIASGYPLMDVDFTLAAGKTLTLSGTGSMRIAPGKALTVAGTADFGGKSVTFQSDATGTSRLAPVTGTLSNATNVTVERYLPSGRKWRLLTAPLTGSSNNSVFYNWQNNDVVSAGRGVEIWGPGGVADPSSSNDGIALGASASMRSYGGSGWSNVTSTHSSLLFDNSTNYGYALFATGPYNNGSTAYIGTPGSLPAAAATTLSATGTLITGIHSKNFTATSAGQYFLVGNPYASPVDPRSFTETPTLNRTNLNAKLWMWDAKPGLGTGNGLGRYVSFDLSSNVYSVLGNGYADDNVMIQSGQAFFVQATAIGPSSLVFRETSKDANGSHAMMGDGIRSAKSLLRLTLQLPVTTDSTENLDGAVAVFHAEGKAGLDPLDGSKLMNSSENIFFRREERNLTFEHRPLVTAKDTLQLRMSNLQNRTYRLQVRATDFPDTDGVKAELTDRFTGISTPINLKGVIDHSFTVTADSLSRGDRFMVLFTKSASTGSGTTERGEVLRLNPYPNPVVQGLPLRVDLEAARAPWDMELIDATGRLVWKQTVKDAGEMSVRIDMSRMGSGVYQLLMTDVKGQRTVSRVVKP